MNNSDVCARLDRIAAKLEAEISSRGLDDNGDPLSDGALMAFTFLAAAVGIAARGADYFTDEEAAAFEQMAGKIISMCDAGQ